MLGKYLQCISLHEMRMQAARNLHALLAARALACLAGVVPSVRATPPHTPAQEALSRLLTPPLAIRLCDADPRPLLSQLTSSISSPQVGAFWMHIEHPLVYQSGKPYFDACFPCTVCRGASLHSSRGSGVTHHCPMASS